MQEAGRCWNRSCKSETEAVSRKWNINISEERKNTMKLVIAIVNNDDSAVVSSALTKEGFSVTRLSTTGGFLMVGNTTFLIGTEDDKVKMCKSIIQKYAMPRKHAVNTTESFGRGFADGALQHEVLMGGATVFVLSVDEVEKY